jgi:hypothetical protein
VYCEVRKKSCVFWDVMLVSCVAYSSILKIEVICSTGMSVDDFRQTTCHNIPEHRTLNNHHCENLKSNVNSLSVPQ